MKLFIYPTPPFGTSFCSCQSLAVTEEHHIQFKAKQVPMIVVHKIGCLIFYNCCTKTSYLVTMLQQIKKATVDSEFFIRHPSSPAV